MCDPCCFPCDPCCAPCCEPICPPCGPCCPPKSCKDFELRGGVLYSKCDCVKRNGLQYDCPRAMCQGQPCCLTLPNPSCCPSKFMSRFDGVTFGKPSNPPAPKSCSIRVSCPKPSCNPCCPPMGCSPCCDPCEEYCIGPCGPTTDCAPCYPSC
ncbi:keratin-associated protein 4-6-like [Culicoides brevitarsis]|uniref:keratin-associated protein 4-6-like n=1 Tax=Culicoides brevitarsis TaxID=469753 RepID=UPI00307B1A9B